MRRRDALAAAAACTMAPWAAARGAHPERAERLATAWRIGAADHRVGVIEAGEATLSIVADVAVPTRAHGLLACKDGGFFAVAYRPGDWLWRFDAEGTPQARLDIAGERPRRTLNGHVETSADAAWLFTTETDPVSGAGWISVRDVRTLRRVAQFETRGVDAHQLLRAHEGLLVVANGGIARDANGRKLDSIAMDPSLVRLDIARGGSLTGQWRLSDPQLSLRHLAWSSDGSTLGIALQAEHADESARRDAPLLALWDGGDRLAVPTREASGGGYAGDIAAGPDGGFVLSAQKMRLALWWSPSAPDRLQRVAELTEPCGLASSRDAAQGVWISAGRGLARWHRRDAPRMQAWPAALAPDNHVVRLAGRVAKATPPD